MKKFLSVLFVAILTLSCFVLVACGGSDDTNEKNSGAASSPEEKTETLKMGVGIVNTAKATDADEDKNGSGQVVTNIAGVLVDADGKIVKCVIDCIDCKVEYTSDGKAVSKDSFKSKYELGNDYGMSAIGKTEWYAQIDALCAVVVGKTADEVTALVAESGKGTDAVITAGCTVTIKEYAEAVVAAVKSATDSAATKDDTLKIGIAVEQSGTDATEDKDGSTQLEVTTVVSAVNAGGKVVATYADCTQVKFAFDTTGASKYDASKPVQTKKEKGTAYGMSQYGSDLNGDGAVKEWYEQAAAFEAGCIGKTASEIAGLVNANGYGAESIQTAGCTIAVSDLVKAAVKAATV